MSHEQIQVSAEQVLVEFEATDFFTLSRRYTEADQQLMSSSEWDYEDDSQLTNQIVSRLRMVDLSTVKEEDKEWYQEIMWFWNHHAISCAIGRYRDFEAAERYAELALGWQSEDHPNQITRLFHLLLSGKAEEAKKFAVTVSSDEKEAAAHLLQSAENDWVGF